jgi:hypothetical protein
VVRACIGKAFSGAVIVGRHSHSLVGIEEEIIRYVLPFQEPGGINDYRKDMNKASEYQ